MRELERQEHRRCLAIYRGFILVGRMEHTIYVDILQISTYISISTYYLYIYIIYIYILYIIYIMYIYILILYIYYIYILYILYIHNNVYIK